MFKHCIATDIPFAIGKFQNVVGIFEGPGHRQVPHYKEKAGPSAWHVARIEVEGQNRSEGIGVGVGVGVARIEARAFALALAMSMSR